MNDSDDSPKKFHFPKVNKTHANHVNVILYSCYLKDLGAPQELSYGDWYYVNEDNQGTICKIHTKGDSEMDFGDFEKFSNGYVRMVTQDEAMALLKEFGFEITGGGMGMMITDQDATLCFTNPTLGLVLSTSENNLHAAYLKAAYLAGTIVKSVTDSNIELEKMGLFTRKKK